MVRKEENTSSFIFSLKPSLPKPCMHLLYLKNIERERAGEGEINKRVRLVGLK